MRKRPDTQVNSAMKTGHIELDAKQVEVLNLANAKLPFTISEHNRANETIRMQYRYLDLRFSDMQKNLTLRSDFINACRQYLNKNQFLDIETPTLFRRTPGGAREFIVPTNKGDTFYCLTQSPQQFKQLLMVAGFDKYYQVARCYRDESTKPDRQPEFTQLDIEMSFIDEKDCHSLIESMLKASWPYQPALQTPFRRMKFSDAMTGYGNDKPDLRFGMKFSDVTNFLKVNLTDVTRLESIKEKKDFKAYAFKIEASTGIESAASFKTIEKEFQQLCKNAFTNIPDKFDKEKLVFMSFNVSNGTKISKHMNNSLKTELAKSALNANDGDTIVLLAWEDNEPKLLEILGKLRLNLANLIDKHNLEKNPKSKLLRDPKEFQFLWVVDFPLFSRNEETNELESTHHPFTAPIKEHEILVEEGRDLESVTGQHYDLVLNGEEVAGGSIRIHNSKFQRHLLEKCLNEDAKQLEHLLESFEYGAPPHGGIALGLDRLIALMAGTENIRNVIAFPKAQSGRDIMSKAPAAVPKAELDYYGIKCIENEQE